MSKIQNVFIKQHKRGRLRYLSLFEPICWRTLPSVCLTSIKTPQKLTALYLLLGLALGNARRHISLVNNSLPHFLISNAHIMKRRS